MRWLLDTNVLSETRKPRRSPALAWMEAQDASDLCTSEVSIAELRYGAQLAENSDLRGEIERWVESAVRVQFQGRIYKVTENILLRWRHISRQQEIKRKPCPAVDLLIGAVALENQLTVATRDTKPFAAAGIPVLNPWTGEHFNCV